MSPNKPRASAKIRIKSMPTKILSWEAMLLAAWSPTTPIAHPAAYFLKTTSLNHKKTLDKPQPQITLNSKALNIIRIHKHHKQHH